MRINMERKSRFKWIDFKSRVSQFSVHCTPNPELFVLFTQKTISCKKIALILWKVHVCCQTFFFLIYSLVVNW